MKVVIVLMMGCIVIGCSNRAVYENLQLNERNQCSTLPASQYDECMERISTSYDEYERQRRQLLED